MASALLQTNIPKFKRWMSYITPIKLQNLNSSSGNRLEIYMQNNQFQLVQENAIYSFGLMYKPFLLAFKQLNLKTDLGTKDKVLVLGSGMGSIPHLLQRFYTHSNRSFSLVDIDSVILNLCSDYLQHHNIGNCKFIHEDAIKWLELYGSKNHFDLICVDIFDDIRVPDAFRTQSFFDNVKQVLLENGLVVYNYIEHDHAEFEQLKMNFSAHFELIDVVYFRLNRILVGIKKRDN